MLQDFQDISSHFKILQVGTLANSSGLLAETLSHQEDLPTTGPCGNPGIPVPPGLWSLWGPQTELPAAVSCQQLTLWHQFLHEIFGSSMLTAEVLGRTSKTCLGSLPRTDDLRCLLKSGHISDMFLKSQPTPDRQRSGCLT